MRIAIGSDHAGFRLKNFLKEYLEREGYDVKDVGTYSQDPVHYPEYGFKVAKMVSSGEADRGLLICGSGVGMCIVANRIKGVRAVNAMEPYTAKMSRRHNNSNVLCMGGRFVGEEMALEILKVWLAEPFEGGRHEVRINMIDEV